MSGFAKASTLVLLLTAAFVWCGEMLTSVSGTGVVGGGGADVGVGRGEAVFFGKGKCYTCHSIGDRGSAVRCPNLGIFGQQFTRPVAVRAAERKSSDGYSAVEYLVESLYDPDAFIVSGFSKGLMPPIHRPPIELDDDDIASVTLFLIAESDIDPDAGIRDELRSAQTAFASLRSLSDAPPPAISLPRGKRESGRDMFAEFGCPSCHLVQGVNFHLEEPISAGGVGPELTGIGAIQTWEYLVESILDPSAVVVANPPGVEPGGEGAYADAKGWSKMPQYNDFMTIEHLLDLAEFLTTLTGEDDNTKLYP